jgi:hypothetical protein
MSLATLKKKTQAKYKNASVNTNGFSLNGIHRNQGYVGQSSSGRSLSRPLQTYDSHLRGHGACCGIYKSGPMLQSGIIQNDTSKNVKSSSVSQKEVINRRKGCDNRGGGKMDSDGHVLYNGAACNVVKNDGPKGNNTAGDYVEYIRQKKTQEVIDCVEASQLPKKGLACPAKVKPNCDSVKSEEEMNVAISQSEYLSKKKARCPDDTKNSMYFSHNGGTGVVCGGAA